MKHKLSVSLDEETITQILDELHSGRFRNKSHVVEYAIKKLLEDKNG